MDCVTARTISLKVVNNCIVECIALILESGAKVFPSLITIDNTESGFSCNETLSTGQDDEGDSMVFIHSVTDTSLASVLSDVRNVLSWDVLVGVISSKSVENDCLTFVFSDSGSDGNIAIEGIIGKGLLVDGFAVTLGVVSLL